MYLQSSTTPRASRVRTTPLPPRPGFTGGQTPARPTPPPSAPASTHDENPFAPSAPPNPRSPKASRRAHFTSTTSTTSSTPSRHRTGPRPLTSTIRAMASIQISQAPPAVLMADDYLECECGTPSSPHLILRTSAEVEIHRARSGEDLDGGSEEDDEFQHI
jgi:hypothetical protein